MIRILAEAEKTYPHDRHLKMVPKKAVETGDLIDGNVAVITAGHPVWVAGMTNMIRVLTIQESVMPSK